MIPPPPPPPLSPTQTMRMMMQPPTGHQSSSRAKDDTDAPCRAGGSLTAWWSLRRQRWAIIVDAFLLLHQGQTAMRPDPQSAPIASPRFLRHLCLEVANQFFASSSCLWPCLAVILVALGLALVATGLAGLGGPLACASSHAAALILAVATSKLVWPAARSLISVVTVVVGVAWISPWARAEEKEATMSASLLASSSLRVPSVSVVIPWTVAIA
jgi:hypothetical protein